MIQLRTQYSIRVSIMSDSCFDTIGEAFTSVNNFLVDAGGTTGKAIEYANRDEKSVSQAFFKPYKNPSDFCIRAATIVSAPFAFAILAAEALLGAIYFAFDALAKVCMGDTSNAAESIGSAGACLIGMFTAIISAIISAVVNFVDLIGGGVATIMKQCDGENMVDYPDYPGAM